MLSKYRSISSTLIDYITLQEIKTLLVTGIKVLFNKMNLINIEKRLISLANKVVGYVCQGQSL